MCIFYENKFFFTTRDFGLTVLDPSCIGCSLIMMVQVQSTLPGNSIKNKIPVLLPLPTTIQTSTKVVFSIFFSFNLHVSGSPQTRTFLPRRLLHYSLLEVGECDFLAERLNIVPVKRRLLACPLLPPPTRRADERYRDTHKYYRGIRVSATETSTGRADGWYTQPLRGG